MRVVHVIWLRVLPHILICFFFNARLKTFKQFPSLDRVEKYRVYNVIVSARSAATDGTTDQSGTKFREIGVRTHIRGV